MLIQLRLILVLGIVVILSFFLGAEAQIKTAEIEVTDEDSFTTITGDLKVTGYMSDSGMNIGVSAANTTATIDMNNYEGLAWEVVGIRHRWANDPGSIQSRSVKYIVTIDPWHKQFCHIELIGGNTSGWGGCGRTGAVSIDPGNCTLTS